MTFPSPKAAPGENPNASPLPWAVLALLVCLIAISSQSLWIDEAFMAGKASQPTLSGWWRMMPKGGGSDLQMPFYMFYMWAFAKIFGLGEWTLRAANIPWFIAGVAAFIPAFPKKQRLAAAAVTLLCPFAWFYLNEGRPYAMQLGASLVIFAAIYRLSGEALPPRSEQNWITLFWLGVIVLCGSSLLGVLWAGAAFLSLPFLFPVKRLTQLLRAHWLACLLSGIVLAALATYYIWTIKFGTRGLDTADKPDGSAALTAVKSAAHFRQGFAGGTELQNLAYLFYELLGFTGLGPGKLEIRTAGPHAFRHFAPQLAAYALAMFSIFLLALPRLFHAPALAKKTALAFAILLPMLLLVGAGYFLGFLVLARHCTPLLPALFFLLSVGLVSACASGRPVFKFAAGVFLILSFCSCLSLRFAARHAKDDYRDAAQAANAALSRGEKVWWSASDDGAAYYQVPLAAAPEQGRAVLVLNPTPQSLSARPAPDLVITSKPDLYDNQKALEKYVRDNPYTQIATFPAFAVWQRKSGQTNH
jgi:hypothetical protein